MASSRVSSTRTSANPSRSRCLCSAGTIVSGAIPTTKRNWQRAHARPAMALTGMAGLPTFMASTAKLVQPNTRSAGVRPGSPQSASISGPSLPPPGSQSANARFTESGIGAGRHSGTRMAPRASVMVAMACAKRMPGSAMSPPQLPEWCAPGRSSSTRSKFFTPRAPRNIVGRSGCRRGPSEAMKTSARNASRCAQHTSARPGEPTSSPASMRNFALKPSLPRVASTAAIAAKLMLCWPLLSAVPRP